jgi:hypothetical protein
MGRFLLTIASYEERERVQTVSEHIEQQFKDTWEHAALTYIANAIPGCHIDSIAWVEDYQLFLEAKIWNVSFQGKIAMAPLAEGATQAIKAALDTARPLFQRRRFFHCVQEMEVALVPFPATPSTKWHRRALQSAQDEEERPTEQWVACEQLFETPAVGLLLDGTRRGTKQTYWQYHGLEEFRPTTVARVLRSTK